MTLSYEVIKSRYDAAGQGHVFKYYDALSSTEQQRYLAQLDRIDVQRLNAITATALTAQAKELANQKAGTSAVLEPLPSTCFATAIDNASQAQGWWKEGIDAIRRGEVAVILMAGGQGTRLGTTEPKGCFDIGLPSGKSLFQYQAERIGRLQELAGATVRWYIMTSGPTRKATEEFFENGGPKSKPGTPYFGLKKADVVFFEQGTLPALTKDGKIILKGPGEVSEAPDGNGGIYAALAQRQLSSGISVLDDLASHQIKYLHAYCVDNCLVRVADPTFIGYCVSQNAECAAKVVRKTDPVESVGVVAVRDGAYGVVEYSEISKADAERRDTQGQLSLRAANIANHFYTLEFLNGVLKFETEMAYHIANKNIDSVDATGKAAAVKVAGMKLELFVFDVFPFTQKDRFKVFEVAREDEFSPLKNKSGPDSPETSKRDLLTQHGQWLKAVGVEVAEGAEVEVSPLVSYAGEGLDVPGKASKKYETTAVLERD